MLRMAATTTSVSARTGTSPSEPAMSVLIRFAPAALTAQQYDEAIRKLGDDAPDGRDYHVCFGSDRNLPIRTSHECSYPLRPRSPDSSAVRRSDPQAR